MTALYKISEVAELLKVSARTLQDWIYRGEFPYLRIGRGSKGTLRFSQAMIDQYLANRMIQPGDVPPPPPRVPGGRPGRRPGQQCRLETLERFATFIKGPEKIK